MVLSDRIEPEIGDISPLFPSGVDKEPMFLIDTTNSMTWANQEGEALQRNEILSEALSKVTGILTHGDHEGLITVTFAGGQAHNLGRLSPENFQEKWDKIQWTGQTQIMPGWNLLGQTYRDEFADAPEGPQVLALIFTDGEPQDASEFSTAVEQVKDTGQVVVGVMGYGDEHTQALKSYREIASGKDHMRVLTFGNETTPEQIASSVLSLLG